MSWLLLPGKPCLLSFVSARHLLRLQIASLSVVFYFWLSAVRAKARSSV